MFSLLHARRLLELQQQRVEGPLVAGRIAQRPVNGRVQRVAASDETRQPLLVQQAVDVLQGAKHKEQCTTRDDEWADG